MEKLDITVVALAASLAAIGAFYVSMPSQPGDEEPGITKPDSCGNGVCDMVLTGNYCCGPGSRNVTENHINCPEECTETPALEDFALMPFRPLVSGLRMVPTSACSLGYIAKQAGKYYVITAGHCVPGAQLYNMTGDLVGTYFEQGHAPLGRVVRVPKDYWYDLALIEVQEGVEAAQMTALGHKYSGFGVPYVGRRVFKVGSTTGLTNGTIEEIQEAYILAEDGTHLNYTRIKIKADGSVFAGQGDSGSAVLSEEVPHRFLGTVMMTGSGYSWAITPDEIARELGLEGAS